MKAIILSIVLLAGCTSLPTPQTVNQMQVVTYSQIATLALDARAAFDAGLISEEQRLVVHDKLVEVMDLMNGASDMVEAGRLLGEVVEILQ